MPRRVVGATGALLFGARSIFLTVGQPAATAFVSAVRTHTTTPQTQIAWGVMV